MVAVSVLVFHTVEGTKGLFPSVFGVCGQKECGTEYVGFVFIGTKVGGGMKKCAGHDDVVQ